MDKLTEWLTKPFLDESVDLPIEIGDTVKMGKFKNKKVVVKKIDWNEKGDLLINGRPALKFRLMPKTNIFDESPRVQSSKERRLKNTIEKKKRYPLYVKVEKKVLKKLAKDGKWKSVPNSWTKLGKYQNPDDPGERYNKRAMRDVWSDIMRQTDKEYKKKYKITYDQEIDKITKQFVKEEWPKNWIPTGLGMRKRQKRVYGRLNRSIREGVNDPGIFKAVFLAGGPGSGKSYVAGGLFGIPDKVSVSAYGLKLVNQDTELENFLKKYYGTTDLDNMPDDLFRQLTDPTDPDYSGLRTHSKALSKQRLKLYSKGRLGVIIDGTGHKFGEVKKERKKLIDLGYDTYMVFVNTSLEVAQMRNKLRDRVLPSELVEKYWNNVQKNMAYFQGLFGGSNFMLVDNNATLTPKQAQKKFNMLVKKGISKFIKKPIKSRLAKKWIEKQKIVKEFIGITAGDGTISGAPDPKKVRKIKKKLDKEREDDQYRTLDEAKQKLKLNIPTDIKKIHKLFKKNKKQLYVVGGAVRDAILGKSPKDFDMATDAKPDEVLAIAKQGKFKTVEVGKSFGVVMVNGHEIATFRKDIGKGRRPDAVDFTDIKGDVKRRDLTINALFYDIDKNTIVDLVGGIKDLKKKQVRTVGLADERFDEDPLRKLRALRFQATIGGKIHPDTLSALKKDPSIKGVSVERIREEFVKSLTKAKKPSNYLKLANNLGMLQQILPGLSINKKFINSKDYIVQLAYLLKDNNPDKLGNKLNSMRYTVKESTNVLFLVSLQNFKSEEIYMFKKFQEKTNLTIAQIKEYGKLIGNESDVVKMAKFKLSVGSKDISKDLKGPEIGKAIKTKEKEKFLNEIAIRPIKSFRDLYTALPSDLKKRVMDLKKVKQRKDAHPEGNVLKHTITVVNRAMKLNPGDIDLALAALFHDIGKDETAGIHPKKGHPTHYGHEHVSAKLVKKYRTWIKSMGGNPVDIYYIVKQHMRVKNVDVMKIAKQRKLKQFRTYDKLKKFSDKMDKGGLKVDEDFILEFVNKPKMKKALKTLIDKKVLPKNYAKNISKLQTFLSNNPLVMTQLLRLLGENINESKKEFVIWGIPPGKRQEDILYTKAKSHSEAKKIIKILTAKHGVTKARIQVLDMAQDPKDIWKADKLFKEETSKIKKIVGIYAGRFQPFGPHHKKVYEWMKKQFDDAYITTSDIKKPPKHPMNFKEKKRHMLKMGIPSNKIVKERQPYVAVNTLKKFTEDTTAVVYIFGKKDADRLSGGTKKGGEKTYYQDYKKNKKNLVGHNKHGYILTAPHFSIQAGGMEVSGTAMRQLLGSPKYADDRERRFKKFFGYFDKGVYNMMTNKFKKLFGEDVVVTKELIQDFLADVDVSKYLNEATFQVNAPIDDGPAHYYKGFRDYKKGSTEWLDSIFKETGWVVLNHMLADEAHDPAFDYTLNYRFMPTPSYGTVGIKGRQSERNLHNKYKERLNFVLSNLGFEVIKWLGLEDNVLKVQVQEPVLPGADDETENTDLKESKLFSKEWWNKKLLKEAGEEYWTDKSVDAQQDYISKHKTSKNVEPDNPSGKKERGNVVKTKPYSKEQAEEEVGEYFENDDAFEAMPNLAKDEADLIQKIQDAPEEVLSDDDLRNMINSDAGDVLKADNPMKHAHKKAIEYDKSWDYITKSIKSGKPQEAPIAVRDKNGKMWLLAGNTRLMAQTGHGNKIPVKIIDFDGDIKVPQQESINENLKLILEIDERMTLEEGVKFNNFLKDWSNKAKQPLDKVRKSMMNKNTFSVAKLNDFSVDKVFEGAKKGFKAYQKIINYVPDKIAQKLATTKFGQKKEKSLVKLDDYLKEHPKLKRVMGIGAAAAVTYAWTKMTFIGDPEYDLDLSAAATAAAVGDVSFAQLFSGEMGTKFLVLTAVGAATGLTAPYVKAFGRVGTMAAGVSFGAYRAYKARKQKKADTEKKPKTSAPDTVKNPNPRGRKKTISRKSAVQWVAKNKGDKAAKKYVKSLSEKISIVEDLDLLIEGGAYGHMNHPFDDKDLTFGDLKKIITDGLGGNLNREDGVTEKLDGQNLMISWKDGKLVTARNKGQLKNFGEKAMTTKGVASKFAGRGDIKNAFVFAMKDLSKSIGALSDAQKEKVFGNGKRWMNLEVMWPKSSNVIDYDKAQIVFHGTLEYDDSGNPIGQPKGSARMLAGMIKQVNQHIQKHYKIGKPQFLSVPKSQNFDAKKKTFLSRLSKLQKEYALKDKDTLALYHQRYWEEFIFNAEKQFRVKITNKAYKSLVKRWAFFDKSYKIPMIKKDFKKYPDFLDWVLTTDKVDHQKMVKQNMRPFEVLFFAVGTEILKNISGYLAASPDDAVQKIRKNVIGAIAKVKTAKDIKKLEALKLQVSKLNSIGGLDSIVPSEGIVFKYKGKVYKFTGAFAPVNQILGLLTF